MVGSTVLGYLCCVVAGVGFGSNYLPVKGVNVGDGVFFSACMAVGILLVGTIENFTLANEDYALWPPHRPPKFEVLAAAGGGLWMLGNLFCPVIVEWLGLGLGLAVWDCFNLLTGWATGNFGLFGVWEESVSSPWMNYLGVAMAMVSLVVLAFASDQVEPEAEAGNHDLKIKAQTAAKSDASGAPDLEQPTSPADEQAAEQPTEMIHEVGSASLTKLASDESTSTLKRNFTIVSMASTACSSNEDNDDDEASNDLESGADCLDRPEVMVPSLSEIPEKPERLSEIGIPENPSQRSLPEPRRSLESAGAARRFLASKLAAFQGLSLAQRRQAYGFLLSILAGFLFGLTFDLPTDLMQLGKLGEDHSTNPLDYVFSHFCGIGITGALALAVYVSVKRERSHMPRNIVLPAIASGVMWAVAQVAWFQANAELSLVVAFPVISTLPGIVGMFWGYLLFGEFRTTRSRRLAVVGMAIRIPAVALISLSAVI